MNSNRKNNFLIGTKTFAVIFSMFIANMVALAQSAAPNPCSWNYIDGNPESTRLNKIKSEPQSLDSFRVKWSIDAVAGDVRPLIGNIVNNSKINKNFKYHPNEIAALMSGRIAIIDATGNIHKYNDYMPFVKDLSVLIDTLSTDPFTTSNQTTLVMGIESIEMDSPDGLSHAYLAGFDSQADTAKLLRRLTLDLREYKPNSYANIKPVFGRKSSNSADYSIFSVINCASPRWDTSHTPLPYFRGITEFITKNSTPNYPMPDVKDVLTNRYHMPGDVGFATPSISKIAGKTLMALPYYAYHSNFYDSIKVHDVNFDNELSGNLPYLAIFDISSNVTKPLFQPIDLSKITKGSKPQIRPYFINSIDRATGDSAFFIVAEEYLGRDSSFGTPKLHLFNLNGDSLCSVGSFTNPPFSSKQDNHQWTIAVGNVDGNAANSWTEYFPNNPGNEILVTETTRDFAVAESKLYVLRYYSGQRQLKPSPPNHLLFPFDTICTKRINGWIAAVNDIDGAPDGKDEIFLVDGSTLRILRMNDYSSYEFRSWNPFDTVYTATFPNQIISNVAIADLEGDGLNDIVVTTQDSTYLIGIDILNVINVLSPKTPPGVLCVGDTLPLIWHNVVKTSNRIDIMFQPTKDKKIFGNPITINKDFKNTADTTRYSYIISNNLAGKEGYFIIQQSDNPFAVNDITAIVSVSKPSIDINISNPENLFVGSNMYIDGKAECVDTIQLQLSNDGGTTWYTQDTIIVNSKDSFTNEFKLPCPDYFNCSDSDVDKYLLVRGIYSKYDYIDTSKVIPAKLKPMPFPVSVEQCTSACPTRSFSWDLSSAVITDSIIHISLSVDNGMTFTEIATLTNKDSKFQWNVPTNLPKEFVLRFCTNKGCVRTDTTLKRQANEYINSVSPNPFNPITAQLEVVYKIPVDAEATIKILDAANNIVAIPVDNLKRRANTLYCDYWNGIRADGSYCENGIYYLLLEISTGERQVYPVFIKK